MTISRWRATTTTVARSAPLSPSSRRRGRHSARDALRASGFLYPPDDLRDYLAPLHAAGARINTNSWGSGCARGKFCSSGSSGAHELDAFVHAHPDMLVLFAAGNDGDEDGFSSLDSQSYLKARRRRVQSLRRRLGPPFRRAVISGASICRRVLARSAGSIGIDPIDYESCSRYLRRAALRAAPRAAALPCRRRLNRRSPR